MSLRCHTPPEMRGRYLAQLDDRVMRCPTFAVERRVRQGEDPASTAGAASSATALRGGFTTTTALPSLLQLPLLQSSSLLQLPLLQSMKLPSPHFLIIPPSLRNTLVVSSCPSFLLIPLIVIINTWSTTLLYSDVYLTVYYYHRIITYCSWKVFVTLTLALFYNHVLSFYGNTIII